MPDIITSREQWIEMQKRKDVTLEDLRGGAPRLRAVQRGGRQVATSRDVKYGRTHAARRARHGHHRELQPHRLDPRAADRAAT